MGHRCRAEQPPADDRFAELLFDQYVSLAREEAAEEDWRDVDRYLSRAAALSDGNVVEPEALADRDIREEDLDAVGSARDRLVAALQLGGRIFAPTDAAQAQAAFDCWMQELEEGTQPEDIAVCREQFQEAIVRLEASLQGDVVAILEDGADRPSALEVTTTDGSVELTSPGSATLVSATTGALTDPQVLPPDLTDTLFGDAIDAEPMPPDRFILYFEDGSTDLNEDSRGRLTDLLRAIELRDGARVDVIGHADRVGPEPLNAILSRRRAEVVARLIVDQAAETPVMTIGSYGEQDPVVPTADEVAEPQNRRVEVTVR